MSKREQIEDFVEEFEECDRECDDCRLSNYITIFNTQYLLCDLVDIIYSKAIEKFKKENHIK